jgi:hypothetical protein
MNELAEVLERHLSGDWGEVTKSDAVENEDAGRHGGRILSIYHTVPKHRVYVITDSANETTKVLLASPD